MDRIYGLRWEEGAGKTRDSLREDRRKMLFTALHKVVGAPYDPPSQPVSGDERTRNILISQSMMVQYVISEAEIVVLVIHVIDGSDGKRALDGSV